MRTLRRHAPRLHRQVSAGELSVSQAVARHRAESKLGELSAKAAAAPSAQGPESWRIITGDCVAQMPLLARRAFRLVFADPPYNEGVDYGAGRGADRQAPAAYLGWCERWMREAAELLTPDGSMWVLISEDYAADLHNLLRGVGLHRRAWLVWREGFGVYRADNFGRCARHLLYFVKDPARVVFNAHAVTVPSDRQAKYNDARANPAGKIIDNVWDVPRVAGTHPERIPDFPTQLPVELLRRVVGCATDPGDQVLDPFNGSGTTGAACVELGRRYVGIDKGKRFAERSRLRLRGVTVRAA